MDTISETWPERGVKEIKSGAERGVVKNTGERELELKGSAG